ncbi:rCG58789 [Rattus norvegicus]|uniref:RCG58789 n=1 Tax=Rattus norvegicus TaxID=10116 RepID=A6JLF3_RAT|nr:rCG58789 [Rattus norvegicus]
MSCTCSSAEGHHGLSYGRYQGGLGPLGTFSGRPALEYLSKRLESGRDIG